MNGLKGFSKQISVQKLVRITSSLFLLNRRLKFQVAPLNKYGETVTREKKKAEPAAAHRRDYIRVKGG